MHELTQQAAQALHENHGARVSELAAMAYLSHNLLLKFERDNKVNLRRMRDLQRVVMFGYATSVGISPIEFRKAFEAMDQATESATYVATYGD